MRKISLILFCIIHWGIIQGQSIDELFVSMPSSFAMPLSNSNRLDLLDLYKAGEKAEIKDILNGSCTLENYTTDYLQWTTGNNKYELILLPMINDSKLLCYIQTVCGPVCDSELQFFTTSWKELDSNAFITPVDRTFFIRIPDKDDYAFTSAIANLDVAFMKFDYNPEKKELYQQYTSPDYLDFDSKKVFLPYIKEDPKKYKWTSVRFE